MYFYKLNKHNYIFTYDLGGLKMNKKSMWSLKLNTACIVLIPVAIGINYIGKLFAQTLKLPLWLDSIGTILSAMLAGPIVGGLCGAINNVIYGLQDPMSFVYAITSVAIGITTGILAYKGMFKTIGRTLISALIIALVAIVISTPLNIYAWGGQTGNVWGDAVFASLMAKKAPLWIASFADELVVDVFDKIVVVVISFVIFKGLPKKLTMLYQNNNQIEEI